MHKNLIQVSHNLFINADRIEWVQFHWTEDWSVEWVTIGMVDSEAPHIKLTGEDLKRFRELWLPLLTLGPVKLPSKAQEDASANPA
jgi:hypothetical protein